MTTLIISVWLVINMIHFNTNFRTKPIYVLNIQKYCVINTVFSFDKETFTKSILIFEFFGSYLGVLMEYRITFGGKIDLFAKYNIKSKHKEMFNHTSGGVSFVRFLLFYLGLCCRNLFLYLQNKHLLPGDGHKRQLKQKYKVW